MTSAQTSPPANASPSNRWSIGRVMSDYGIVVALVVLCVVLAVINENFLTWRNWINILRQTSINGVLAIGMTFVILTRGIDLSVGSVLAISAMVTGSLVTGGINNETSILLAVSAGLIVGVVLGSVNGFIVARLAVAPFVVTLGMLSMARGLTFIYSDGMPVSNLDPAFRFLGTGVVGGIPVPVIILLVVFAVCWFVLNHTTFGR